MRRSNGEHLYHSAQVEVLANPPGRCLPPVEHLACSIEPLSDVKEQQAPGSTGKRGERAYRYEDNLARSHARSCAANITVFKKGLDALLVYLTLRGAVHLVFYPADRLRH